MEPDDSSAEELAACLERLASGDLSARERIIELCGGRLRALARRMLARFPDVRRWDDTDDVFQNAALRLHRALGEVRPDSPRAIMALAATQLHRELIDLARHHRGPGSYAANHGTNVGSAPTGDAPRMHHVDRAVADTEGLDRWTLFHEAIMGLPDELREIFHLVWYIGADQKTIARLLGCSERTVKYRWREARDTVKAALEGRGPE
jgi:RNA polymerase sigma factor (sigma-70 family)